MPDVRRRQVCPLEQSARRLMPQVMLQQPLDPCPRPFTTEGSLQHLRRPSGARRSTAACTARRGASPSRCPSRCMQGYSADGFIRRLNADARERLLLAGQDEDQARAGAAPSPPEAWPLPPSGPASRELRVTLSRSEVQSVAEDLSAPQRGCGQTCKWLGVKLPLKLRLHL